MAKRYGVSRETWLRRLLICERITDALYDRKVREYHEECAQHAQQRPAEGFAPPHQVAISVEAARLHRRLDELDIEKLSTLLESKQDGAASRSEPAANERR